MYSSCKYFISFKVKLCQLKTSYSMISLPLCCSPRSPTSLPTQACFSENDAGFKNSRYFCTLICKSCVAGGFDSFARNDRIISIKCRVQILTIGLQDRVYYSRNGQAFIWGPVFSNPT